MDLVSGYSVLEVSVENPGSLIPWLCRKEISRSSQLSEKNYPGFALAENASNHVVQMEFRGFGAVRYPIGTVWHKKWLNTIQDKCGKHERTVERAPGGVFDDFPFQLTDKNLWILIKILIPSCFRAFHRCSDHKYWLFCLPGVFRIPETPKQSIFNSLYSPKAPKSVKPDTVTTQCGTV